MKNQSLLTRRLVHLSVVFLLLINWPALPSVTRSSFAASVDDPVTTATASAVRPVNDAASLARLRKQYHNLPLRFEAATAQANAPARFIARNSTFGIALSASEASVALPLADATGGLSTSSSSREASLIDHAGWRLVGANRHARICGEAQSLTRVNYLIGEDAAQWRTGVASYARVRVARVYRGVDLVYYGSGRELEYDFDLAPGADAKAIRLRFRGAGRVCVDETGDLIVETQAGPLRHRKPVAYQTVNGARRPVAVSYVIDRRGDVGFHVGDYDQRLPLIIDPVLSYATYFSSGAKDDVIIAVATDGAGNAYVAGYTVRVAPPAVILDDGFIAKLNPEGTDLVYATYLGGHLSEAINGIAVDPAGNAYVIGRTNSLDFPTTARAFQPLPPDDSAHTFVAALNPAGTALVYSTYLAGRSETTSGFVIADGLFIAVNAAGEATVAGQTDSPRFPITDGAVQAAFGGHSDIFVARLSRNGRSLIFSTYLGGDDYDQITGLALDVAGNAYVTGETSSSNFPTTVHAYKPKRTGSDYFVTKISRAGDALVYSTFIGNGSGFLTRGIAADVYGNAYVTGYAYAPDLETTPGAFQPVWAGNGDAFVTKLNAEGTALVYSTYLGGSSTDFAAGIAVDTVGQAQVAGTTFSADFPTVRPLQSHRRGAALYKSTDGGENWDNVTLPLLSVQSLAIDPQTGATLYASNFSGVTKSTDGGATWLPVMPDVFGSLMIDPMVPTTLYAYSVSSFYKSTDAGASWARTGFTPAFPGGSGNFISAVVLDPKAHETVYVSGYALLAQPESFTTQALAPLPTGVLVKSTDGGAGWAVLDNAALSSTALAGDALVRGVTCLAIDPQVPTTLYVSANTLLKSTDGGASWFKPNVDGVFSVSQLLVDPTASATLYAIRNDGVVKSVDGGASWGPPTLKHEGLARLTINPQSPSTLYASGRNAVYKTTDGGASWRQILEGSSTTNVVLDPRQPSTVYASGSIESDIFVTKLNATGTGLVYSTYLGNRGTDSARAIAADARGNVFVIGSTSANNFPTTPNAYLPQSTRPDMGVVLRINDLTPIRITSVEVQGKSLRVTGEGFDQGAVIVAGSMDLATQNDPASPSLLLISARGGKQIPRGQTVAIRVRNADGRVSDPFNFTRGFE